MLLVVGVVVCELIIYVRKHINDKFGFLKSITDRFGFLNHITDRFWLIWIGSSLDWPRIKAVKKLKGTRIKKTVTRLKQYIDNNENLEWNIHLSILEALLNTTEHDAAVEGINKFFLHDWDTDLSIWKAVELEKISKEKYKITNNSEERTEEQSRIINALKAIMGETISLGNGLLGYTGSKYVVSKGPPLSIPFTYPWTPVRAALAMIEMGYFEEVKQMLKNTENWTYKRLSAIIALGPAKLTSEQDMETREILFYISNKKKRDEEKKEYNRKWREEFFKRDMKYPAEPFDISKSKYEYHDKYKDYDEHVEDGTAFVSETITAAAISLGTRGDERALPILEEIIKIYHSENMATYEVRVGTVHHFNEVTQRWGSGPKHEEYYRSVFVALLATLTRLKHHLNKKETKS